MFDTTLQVQKKVYPSSEGSTTPLGGGGRNDPSDTPHFISFIHLLWIFFFSARSVLAGPGNSEVTETGPCVDNDKVECGDFIARS